MVSLHDRLISAATAYDRRCEAAEVRQRVSVNIYRLAHVFGGIERAEQRLAKGATVREALCASFNGRLLDVMLKAAGEPKGTLGEIRGYGAGAP